MVSEAIRRVKEAEGGAEESERDARGAAKRLIGEAHEACQRMRDEMRREMRAEERALIESAQAEAETEAARIIDESKSGVEDVGRGAGARIRAGVSRVLDAITATT